LVLALNDACPITVDTPPWFAWLEHASTFAFTSPAGRFTAHGEGTPQTGRLRAYIDMVLVAFPGRAAHAGNERATNDQLAIANRPSALVEPLTEREHDVLRLLGTDLNGPEVAHELMVSLNTTRTHTKNIYTNLGVTNRRATVR
jgi:LuxR family maltose regulon positive regulatory protein